MIEIVNADDSRISYYRSLKFTPVLHTENNLFIAEGRRVVEKLLKSNLEIVSFFATDEFYDIYSSLIKEHNIPEDQQFITSKSLMKEIVGFKIHTGIMAMAKQPAFVPLTDLSDTIAAVDNVVDAENIGSIIRNTAAFNYDSFLFSNSSASPYLRRSVRVSMGTIFNIKVSYTTDFIQTLKELQSSGYTIISAEINNNSINVYDYKFPKKKVIIFGNEANGISQEVLNISDAVLHIPINENVPSINVAATSAVFLNLLQHNI